MLEPIYLPDQVTVEEDGPNAATFHIYPYHPGYGPTVGNALRRVLLSSLPGAAITHVKISGVEHDFSTISGIREDMVTLILNLKRVRLSLDGDEPVDITLTAKGVKKVTAGDFSVPPGVTLANPETPLVTLTDKKAEFEMVCTVERGRGYVPSEEREGEARDIGTIALDAIFTPVQRVSFRVERARVGRETDYHKLLLSIATDGTISPQEALNQAASILADHYRELTGDFVARLTSERPAEEAEIETATDEERQPENTLNLLQLPSRVHNALERVGVTSVEQIMELTEEQIQDIPGLGEKAVQDILAARNNFQAGQKEQGDEA
ncbi:MAG: DNA-directed RNA polymerase subunit alpha [Candidatus Andersenbacteria bacterium CG10_big_fil_rev_8_21_14_0_10_54_11]|uniref:DNA-directed RNA polymerase subunit alpha n=1 Tax=Candidatus Andersenbacteria bacterium CG10_big_fil_rev_8_21_14_0_10_54_11 TaxID=1974485 RepID=A0A2M6WYG1_9BACT|nr:MAG: DNA-directed RNA polymerase subunit alpha [Candidatus Andersenbacteria bacterium CG10_big_fil_rev_8_21_14_0_10_54_11]